MKVIDSSGGDEGNAHAILREIETLLRALIERDESGSIDMRSLPMSEESRALLEEALGEGEVVAEINALGPTRVSETGIPGVWWVQHFNEEEAPVAEFIEVAYCPEILISPVEDVKEGWEALRARLFESEFMNK